MKIKSLFFVLLGVSFSIPTFAQHREFFKENIFNEETDIPVSLGREYYDAVVKHRPIYDLTFEEWFNGPHALASWGGARRFIENNGVVPAISYVGNFASNPGGGKSRGATNTSSVNLGFGIDLHELTQLNALNGWTIGNTWVWRFGDSLTNRRVGNAFNVQQNYGSQTIQLQSLFASYNKDILADWHWTFKFGRFAAGDNFMTKPIYWLYQNNAFDGNPVGVFKQTRLSAYPGSTWAMFSQLTYKDGQYAKAGVYKINTPKQDNQHGLDFDFRGDGVNANFEFGWNINHDASGKSPANISAGLVAQWYDAPHIDNPMSVSNFNCSLYIQADYMIYNMGYVKEDEPYYIVRDSDKWRDLRGLILWGAFQFDPYEYLADMPIFVNGGLLFNAPFKSRADDVICFGVAYGKFSNRYSDFRKNSYEMVFEVNYKYQINRFSFIQPNMQFILHTNGGEYPSALVLGIQYGINL